MTAVVSGGVAAVLLLVVGVLVVRAPSGRPRGGHVGFVAASRGVTPLWNASAISGEYLSAAAFLGIAGMVLAHGADMVWLPAGAAAGYVLLLAFVTAPLRRSGAYTLADFAEWRLGSQRVRRIVSLTICLVGWLYLLPQLRGAGVTLRVLTGAPMWVGWTVVVAVVLVVVLSGGVRSVTAVQAVSFWAKLVAIVVPILAVVMIARPEAGAAGGGPPVFPRDTTVHVRTDVVVRAPAAVVARVDGRVDGTRHGGAPVRLAAGRHTVAAGTEVAFPAGAAVPHVEDLPVQDHRTWAAPFGGEPGHRVYGTYAMLLGVALGTMGLPHILLRFYTDGSGHAARRTAAMVPALLAPFYVFPALYGALGRLHAPELLMTGATDAAVLTLPAHLVPGTGGALLTGLVVAGAFAAFIATSCGLVWAIAGVVAQCLTRTVAGPLARMPVRAFRAGAVVAVAVPLPVMPWAVAEQAAGRLVMPAMLVSACSLAPLLLLGLWWRGLTPAGAAAGLVTGACSAAVLAVAGLVAGPARGWTGTLLANPAPLLLPVVFGVAAGVSLATRRSVPPHAGRAMARLHLPEDRAGDRSSRRTDRSPDGDSAYVDDY